jgi:hypothetical protein
MKRLFFIIRKKKHNIVNYLQMIGKIPLNGRNMTCHTTSMQVSKPPHTQIPLNGRNMTCHTTSMQVSKPPHTQIPLNGRNMTMSQQVCIFPNYHTPEFH